MTVSTHVLDATLGAPAAGVLVSLAFSAPDSSCNPFGSCIHASRSVVQMISICALSGRPSW